MPVGHSPPAAIIFISYFLKNDMKAITPRELMGRLLNDTEEKYAPKEIYVKGPMDLPLPRSRVSVIGTRRPTKEGIAEARAVSKMLTGNGVTVVSGLAAGIDEVSHQAAIAAGGKTVAVLGTPLDKTYPASNHRLQMDIMKNHLAVSQFPTGSPIARRNFVIRNRLMALISDASVIVEAGEGSGTLHHGWETLRLGRPLYVCSPVAKAGHKWLTEMKRYGATVLKEHTDVLDMLPKVEMIDVFV